MERTPAAGARVTIHVCGDLRDFLPARLRDVAITRPLDGRPGVKDVIEAIGIPHPEIGRVTVNGREVTLVERVGPGDEIEVEPLAEGAPAAGPAARFVLDGHLGRLAAYLRMAGFDSWYERDADDEALARRSAEEDRILLTRDLGLLRRGIVRRGAFVRSDRPPEQLVEVIARFGLVERVEPFGRCMRCNEPLEKARPADVAHLVPPRVLREQADFRRCPACGGIYWRGSHHRRMERILAEALETARERLEAAQARPEPAKARPGPS